MAQCKAHLRRHKVGDVRILRLRKLLDGILHAGDKVSLPLRVVWPASILTFRRTLPESGAGRGRGAAFVCHRGSGGLPCDAVEDVLVVAEHIVDEVEDAERKRAGCAMTETAKPGRCVVRRAAAGWLVSETGATSDLSQPARTTTSIPHAARGQQPSTLSFFHTDRHGLQMVMAPVLFLATCCLDCRCL